MWRCSSGALSPCDPSSTPCGERHAPQSVVRTGWLEKVGSFRASSPHAALSAKGISEDLSVQQHDSIPPDSGTIAEGGALTEDMARRSGSQPVEHALLVSLPTEHMASRLTLAAGTQAWVDVCMHVMTVKGM